jgi:hypothetical protein
VAWKVLQIFRRIEPMMRRKFDRKSKESRQFLAWLVGSAVMPFAAYPFVKDSIPSTDFDLPMALILGLCWSVISFLLSIYIKKNVH